MRLFPLVEVPKAARAGAALTRAPKYLKLTISAIPDRNEGQRVGKRMNGEEKSDLYQKRDKKNEKSRNDLKGARNINYSQV
jgi:hypothetical protein